MSRVSVISILSFSRRRGQVAQGKWSVCILMLIVVPCSKAICETPVARPFYDEDVGTHVLYLSPCHGLQCKAAKDLEAAYDAIMNRDLPNSMAQFGEDTALKRRAKEVRVLDDLPYKHRERVPLYCDWLTEIAQHDPDVFAVYTYNTSEVIELAARLDAVDTKCLSEVINALPRTPDMDKIIADTHGICRLDYPHYHCDKIARPPVQSRK